MKERIKLQHGEIYTYDSKEGFTLYDPLTFAYNGFDIASLYEHYKDKGKILEAQQIYYTKLSEWLKKYKIKTKGKGLYELLDEVIAKVTPLNDTLDYYYFSIDEEGYINDYTLLKGKITQDKIDIPLDIYNGCYKLDNGVIILDEIKYEREWI